MRKRRFSPDVTSPFENYLREELGGLKLDEMVSWKEPIDDVIYRGSVHQLIEHPIHGNIVTVYCQSGGFRSKKVSDVSKKRVKRRGRGRPRKSEQ